MSRPGFKRVEPFSPTQISNCCLWLDASDTTTITLSGSNVTQWRDKSGSNNHGTGVNNPTYSNGTMNFVHASQTCFTLPNGALPSGNASCGYFVVFTNNDSSVGNAPSPLTDGTALIGGGQTEGWNAWEMWSRATQTLYWGVWYSAISTPYTTLNSNTIFSTQYNSNGGGANGIGTMVVNGTIVGSQTGWGPRTQTNNNNYVGSMYRGTAYAHSGTISEVIVYSNALTTQQQQQIEGYLAQKWQFKNALPGGHLGQTGIIYPTVRRNGTLNTASSTLPYYTQFSPLSISGCKIWLDATDSSTFTLNGSTVSAWNDKTGNGYNVIQATTSNQPTRGTNEVIFNGTNHILQYTGSIGISGNPYTAYVIYKATVIDVYLRGAVTCMDSTSGFSFEIGQFDRWTPSSASTYLQFSSSSNITLMGINSEPAGSVRQSLNGQAFSAGGAGWPAPASGSALAVGYSLAKAWYFGGSIYEFLLFSRTLTDTEHNQITGYLASKWGSQTYLPSNHPNKTVSVGTLPLVTNLIGTPHRNMIPKPIVIATGGDSVVTANGYRTHTYTTVGSSSFVLTSTVPGLSFQVLVVSGGGAGGGNVGGGGGAGGAQLLTPTLSVGSYTVTVGNGGAIDSGTGQGQSGGSSTFNATTIVGGGAGGVYGANSGLAGACGGGAGNTYTYGTGSVGSNGGSTSGICGGGGGGMGGAGTSGSGYNGGTGGAGLSYTIGGVSYTVCGGGGGAGYDVAGTAGVGGSGGSGVGAAGATVNNQPGGALAPTANRGGGGGGGTNNGNDAASPGAAGIVIVSYVYP